MTWGDALLLIMCGILIMLPPKYDPAIRLKEANIRWAARIRKRNEKE